jgi:uncharacterized protein YdeI (YjbR/CyaY-like superfamily)
MNFDREKYKKVEPESRAEWRAWLQKNHTQKESIWLVLYKKGHEGSSLAVGEAVEEALCFGWIDGLTNKMDEKRFKLLLAPRKPKGVWSKINKARVARLIKTGQMQPAGLAIIKQAKKSGAWNALNDSDSLKYPQDLVKAFSKNKKAKKHFDAFPPSAKKMILWWIQSAKTKETQARRLNETVEKASENIRANQYVKKK